MSGQSKIRPTVDVDATIDTLIRKDLCHSAERLPTGSAEAPKPNRPCTSSSTERRRQSRVGCDLRMAHQFRSLR